MKPCISSEPYDATTSLHKVKCECRLMAVEAWSERDISGVSVKRFFGLIAKTVKNGAVCAAIAMMTFGGIAFAATPDGLYLMTRFNSFSNSLEIKGWYFKNGQATYQPYGNLANYDFKAAAAKCPHAVGSYSISGNSMTINWANGKKSTGKYETKDNGCFNFDLGIFCPAKPFTSSTIDGTFTGGASVGGGAVANGTTITFSPNGTYKLNTAGSVSTTGREVGAFAGSVGSESGTYKLSGTTLTLNGGGRTRQIVSFPYDDGTKGPQPRNIFYDGVILKRM